MRTERGFGLPQVIILIVFLLFVGLLSIKIYQAYLQKNVQDSGNILLRNS